MAIVNMVGVDKICSIMALDNEEIALATSNLFQCINDSLTGADTREYGKEAALVLGEEQCSLVKHSLKESYTLFFCVHFSQSMTKWQRRLFSFKNNYSKDTTWLFADAAKDLKTILLALLEMIANKNVSGYGRDQALNLLSKNVPRSNKKNPDYSRTLFTIDHGKPGSHTRPLLQPEAEAQTH